VDHAVPGIARDLVDARVVDDLVAKALEFRQGGKVFAAVDRVYGNISNTERSTSKNTWQANR